MGRLTNALVTRHAACQKDRISTSGQRASGSMSRRKGHHETAQERGPIVSTIRHIGPARIAKSFSEALAYRYRRRQLDLRRGSGGAWRSHRITSPSASSRRCASPSIASASPCASFDADMGKIVSIKVYLTDLAPYAEFSKVRGEVFPNNPPHIDRSPGRRPFCLGHASRSTQSPLSPKGETQVSAIPSGADRPSRHRSSVQVAALPPAIWC